MNFNKKVMGKQDTNLPPLNPGEELIQPYMHVIYFLWTTEIKQFQGVAFLERSESVIVSGSSAVDRVNQD